MDTDIKQEWRSVKSAFRKYTENLLYLKTSELPSVTQEHQLIMEFGSEIKLVGEYVLKRQAAMEYNKKVVGCVNRLSELERKIIIPSYMNKEYVPPWQIYETSHIGRTLFYTTKARAIGKLHVLFLVESLSSEVAVETRKVRTNTEQIELNMSVK